MSPEILGLVSLGSLFICIFAGFPIAFTLLFLGLVTGYIGIGQVVFNLMTLQVYAIMTEQVLAAVPFFLFMGYLLESSGLMERLFKAFQLMLARLSGSLYVAVTATATIFAAATGIVGSSVTLLGVMAAPTMNQSRYNVRLCAGCITAGGTLGILIPPSIPLVLYGVVTETSIVRLFFAGVIPGILLALANVATIIILAKLINLPRGKFDAGRLWPATLAALPGFGMPVVILGGLYGGFFTPTEAAAVACGYAMLYGLVTKRGEFLRELVPVTMRSLNLSAVILFLVGSVGVFQFLAANLYWPQTITKAITSWGLTPLGFIVAFIAVEMILGCFVDGVAMILLTVPVAYPVAMALKIDPVHLAIILTLTVEMSLVTPPVGLNLFAVSGVSKIPVSDVVRGAVPFFLTDALVLLAVVFFPGLATWLPDLLVVSVFK